MTFRNNAYIPLVPVNIDLCGKLIQLSQVFSEYSMSGNVRFC